MFIRTKKIKGKDYAYLVRNVWRKRIKNGKKGSRQKVSKYLGKVHRFEKIADNDFFKLFNVNDIAKYIEFRGQKGVIKDLIKLELINRGFKEGKILVNSDVQFNMENLAFIRDGKEAKAVIEMNEGFLCKETISKVINFKAGDEEREGMNLADAFVSAGLAVPEEVFVEYYKRFVGL